jgi:hypothetical protein
MVVKAQRKGDMFPILAARPEESSNRTGLNGSFLSEIKVHLLCLKEELFLEWMHHIVKCIPAARPVLLITDSHASHVGIEVIRFCS